MSDNCEVLLDGRVYNVELNKWEEGPCVSDGLGPNVTGCTVNPVFQTFVISHEETSFMEISAQ